MVAPKVEGQHQGEFLVSEAPGTLSREAGVLDAGQKVVDGTLLAAVDGTKLGAVEGDLGTDGGFATPIVGIAYGDYDASATGANADLPIVYIARLAEVKEALIQWPGGSTESTETETEETLKAAAIEELAALFIRPR